MGWAEEYGWLRPKNIGICALPARELHRRTGFYLNSAREGMAFVLSCSRALGGPSDQEIFLVWFITCFFIYCILPFLQRAQDRVRLVLFLPTLAFLTTTPQREVKLRERKPGPKLPNKVNGQLAT